MKSRYKHLASELLAHGVDSPFLARLQAHVHVEDRLEVVNVEHHQEMASALGRTELRVNLAFVELDVCRARYDAALRRGESTAELARLAMAFNLQRQVVNQRVRELLIHREAIGFHRNEILEELYPLQPKLPLPETMVDAA
jgi:hypothetical protein